MRVEANLALLEAGKGESKSNQFASLKRSNHNAAGSFKGHGQGQRSYVGILKAPDFLFEA
jgi:hypothetical protein